MKEIWGIVIYKYKGPIEVYFHNQENWEIIAVSSEMYNKREDAVKFITKTRSGNPKETELYGQYISDDDRLKYVIKGFDLKD